MFLCPEASNPKLLTVVVYKCFSFLFCRVHMVCLYLVPRQVFEEFEHRVSTRVPAMGRFHYLFLTLFVVPERVPRFPKYLLYMVLSTVPRLPPVLCTLLRPYRVHVGGPPVAGCLFLPVHRSLRFLVETHVYVVLVVCLLFLPVPSLPVV